MDKKESGTREERIIKRGKEKKKKKKNRKKERKERHQSGGRSKKMANDRDSGPASRPIVNVSLVSSTGAPVPRGTNLPQCSTDFCESESEREREREKER